MQSAQRALVGVVASVVLGAAAAGSAVATPGASGPAAVSRSAGTVAPENRITVENRLPGSTGWQLPSPGKTMATDSNQAVKAYAKQTSVNVGTGVDVAVSAATPGKVTWAAYRLGWYAGTGGRPVASGVIDAARQPTCPMDATTGLRACAWPTSFTVGTYGLTSGIFVVTLTAGTYQNYAIFTVRDDARPSATLHIQPVNTYQAYNNFPSDGRTGKSLYAFNSYGAVTAGGGTAAVKVSFDRPYAGNGSGNALSDDAPMVWYDESRGIDVTYATTVDVHENADLAAGHQSVVSVGHDEYWTQQMRQHWSAWRDAGVNLAYLGANNGYWQTRYEPAGDGRADRTMIVYRDAWRDPDPDLTEKTTLMRLAAGPEQPVVGAAYESGKSITAAPGPWVVQTADHWLYRGTALADGAQIPGLVAGETSQRVLTDPQEPLPDSTASYVLAHSTFNVPDYGHTGIQDSTLYTAPSGAVVFSASTLAWTRALGSATAVDPRVQAMMMNLTAKLEKFPSTVQTNRLSGTDRYATSAAISASSFPDTVDSVYLATGDDYPDALGAAAATRGASPVLLVTRTAVPDAVTAELTRLQPKHVFVAGSSAVVSDAVLDAVASTTGVQPVRLFGADRFATAVAVSRSAFPTPGVPVVYVATGLNFPDALAAGAAGARLGGPVLLSLTKSVDAGTLAEVARLNPARVVVVGSAAVVADSVLTQLRTKVSRVVRLAGSDRYATSLAVSRDVASADGAGAVAVASGANYPDALAAGPWAAARQGTLVLAPTGLGVAQSEEIVRVDPDLVVAMGGPSVVSDGLMAQVRALFDVADGVPAPVATPLPSSANRSQTTTTPDTGTDEAQRTGPPMPTTPARPAQP